jgi:hypothetical protein
LCKSCAFAIASLASDAIDASSLAVRCGRGQTGEDRLELGVEPVGDVFARVRARLLRVGVATRLENFRPALAHRRPERRD